MHGKNHEAQFSHANFIGRKETSDVNALINELDLEIFKEDSRIKQEDRAECKEYQKYLLDEKMI